MEWMGFPALLWCVVFSALLAVGLLSHVAERWRCHTECQLAFLLMMALVGFMTILSLRIGSGDWVIGCATLAVVVIGSSINVSDHRREPVF